MVLENKYYDLNKQCESSHYNKMSFAGADDQEQEAKNDGGELVKTIFLPPQLPVSTTLEVSEY